MEWMLIPLFLAFIAAGFWWMKGLDRFLDRQKKHAPKKGRFEEGGYAGRWKDSAKEMEKILSFKKIPSLHVSKEFEIDRGLFIIICVRSPTTSRQHHDCDDRGTIFGVRRQYGITLQQPGAPKNFEEKGIPIRCGIGSCCDVYQLSGETAMHKKLNRHIRLIAFSFLGVITVGGLLLLLRSPPRRNLGPHP
jgi:hypothetical protein